MVKKNHEQSQMGTPVNFIQMWMSESNNAVCKICYELSLVPNEPNLVPYRTGPLWNVDQIWFHIEQDPHGT